MKLKQIEIGNYRQFSQVKINFEDTLTFLAGANNSGKTSIIELIKNVMMNNTCNLNVNDLPIEVAQKVSSHLFKVIEKKLKLKEGKVKHIESLQEYMKKVQKVYFPPMPKIYMNVEISYRKEEDIGLFTDYLMDLDDKNQSFYFRFEFTQNTKRLLQIVHERYDKIIKLSNDYFSIVEQAKDDAALKGKVEKTKVEYKQQLLQWYFESFEPVYYYTDRTFEIKEKMKKKTYQKLFYIDIINANKRLTDEDIDPKYSIGQEIIKYISQDEDWKKLIEDLPEDLSEMIDTYEKREMIQDKSLNKLKKTIQEIEQTNGGKSADMFLDIVVGENTIKSLLNNTIQAKYQFEDAILDENAQGLGYSNLIYIHLRLEIFIKNIDSTKLNLFIIEEPEAHMHPQMQRVFSEYLKDYYKDGGFQGLVTTHSSEVISITSLNCIRVIRETGVFKSKLYDFSDFLVKVREKDGTDKELERLFNLLFNLNLSDIIFADRVILYEGDTERMYINALINNSHDNRFSILKNIYIAYVQVGGAYAHKYKYILDFLEVKALIITDIDYIKEFINITEIKKSTTTNSAIKSFYEDEYPNKNPLVEDIYKWNSESKNIKIQFQSEKDGYARTLEEAMILEHLEKDVSIRLSKREWEDYRRKYNLKITIPTKKDQLTIRNIINATGDSSKTEFMYSVILQQLHFDMLPNYIEEGLLWLQE